MRLEWIVFRIGLLSMPWLTPTCLSISRLTGRKIAIGVTVTGRTLIVVFDEIDAHTVYPITAYDLED